MGGADTRDAGWAPVLYSPPYLYISRRRPAPTGWGFVDCTEILFSCSSQILLIWIIQTDIKCFSKMENKP